MTARAVAVRRDPGTGAGLGRRAVALVLVLLVPLTVGLLGTLAPLHPVIGWLCSYSPQRLFRGELWTLPLSGVIQARPRTLGQYTLVSLGVMTPYILGFGIARPLRAYIAGHVIATLAAAVVIGLGAALGWHEASVLFHTRDAGVSAGMAAAGGGLAVALMRTQWRPLAIIVVAALLYLFTERIAAENATRALADGEHLVALVTGAFVERTWGTRGRAARGLPRIAET